MCRTHGVGGLRIGDRHSGGLNSTFYLNRRDFNPWFAILDLRSIRYRALCASLCTRMLGRCSWCSDSEGRPPRRPIGPSRRDAPRHAADRRDWSAASTSRRFQISTTFGWRHYNSESESRSRPSPREFRRPEADLALFWGLSEARLLSGTSLTP